MQDISPVDVFDIDVSPQPDQRVDSPPAASEGGEEERRALLLIHGVDIGALGDQKLHDLGVVEHGGAMQRRHLHKKVLKLKSSHLTPPDLLDVARGQAGQLLLGLHLEHQLDDVRSPLGARQVHGGGQVVLLRGDLRPRTQAQLHGLDVAPVDRRVERHVALRVVERDHFFAGASAGLPPLEEDLQGLGGGVFRRLVDGVVAVVAGAAGTSVENGYLQKQ